MLGGVLVTLCLARRMRLSEVPAEYLDGRLPVCQEQLPSPRPPRWSRSALRWLLWLPRRENVNGRE